MSLAERPSGKWADYARAGFGRELEAGEEPALLLVDPARAYVDPACALYAGGEAAAEAMEELLAAARAAGLPVAVTQELLRGDGSGAGLFFRKAGGLSAFFEGNPHGALIEGLEPAGDELLVTKQYPSAFFGTALSSWLTVQGVDTLLIAGFSTSGCVRATALDAMQHGFVPLVVEEAVADRQPDVHAANLFDIQQKIGEVWSLGRAVDYAAEHRRGTAPTPPG